MALALKSRYHQLTIFLANGHLSPAGCCAYAPGCHSSRSQCLRHLPRSGPTPRREGWEGLMACDRTAGQIGRGICRFPCRPSESGYPPSPLRRAHNPPSHTHTHAHPIFLDPPSRPSDPSDRAQRYAALLTPSDLVTRRNPYLETLKPIAALGMSIGDVLLRPRLQCLFSVLVGPLPQAQMPYT